MGSMLICTWLPLPPKGSSGARFMISLVLYLLLMEAVEALALVAGHVHPELLLRHGHLPTHRPMRGEKVQ